jgi:hypothetical protein
VSAKPLLSRPKVQAMLALVPPLLPPAAFLAGLLLLAWGAWLIYMPAGLLVAGLLLVANSVFYTRAAMRRRR